MLRPVARQLVIQMLYEQLAGGNADSDSLQLAHELLQNKDETSTSDSKDYVDTYVNSTIEGINAHISQIDEYISESLSKEWPFSRLAYINICILRLATYELYYCNDIPNNVVISEAIALAEKYTDPKSSRFINGVLGSMERKMQKG